MLNILPRLKKKGYRIKLFSLRTGGQLEKEFIDEGVELYSQGKSRVKLMWKIKRIIYLCYVLYKERPDVIHFFLPEAYMIGFFCSLFSPASVRIMSRRSLNIYQSKKPILKHVEYFIHRFMSLVLGNSLAVTKELNAEGIEKSKIKLIYNGIVVPRENTLELKQNTRELLGLSKEALIIIVVSNLIPYKGHIDLLYALSKFKKVCDKEWFTICVGRDDGYSSELISLSKQLNINENVKFIGHTRETGLYLFSCDIGILPSHQEGFSNSLLEGMAHSLPMIVTNVGGNAEAITNKVNGYVVPAHNPELLGERIIELAKNKELREKFGKAAYKKVKSGFSIESCVNEYDLVYKNLIEVNG